MIAFLKRLQRRQIMGRFQQPTLGVLRLHLQRGCDQEMMRCKRTLLVCKHPQPSSSHSARSTWTVAGPHVLVHIYAAVAGCRWPPGLGGAQRLAYPSCPCAVVARHCPGPLSATFTVSAPCCRCGAGRCRSRRPRTRCQFCGPACVDCWHCRPHDILGGTRQAHQSR